MFREPLVLEHIDRIHETSMRVLAEVGVCMPQEDALDVFRKHGIKVEHRRVFLSEGDVRAALALVPKEFTLHARNPERNVVVGGGRPVFAPAYGAPFVVDAREGVRPATVNDYRQLAKLSHELPNMDVSGLVIVEPDVPDSHLHMLHAHLVHSDKPFVGSAAGAVGAMHTLEMARLAFAEDLQDHPVCISLVNSLSPLGYATEMLDVLLAYASAGQPVVIAALAMAGTTGPVTLAGVLAMQTAELLAGVVLAQLVNPGTPVVFGSTSSNVDMRAGSLSIGSPELSLLIAAHAQLARYYGIPSRAGGALTDASGPDAQAGFESMLSLCAAVECDVDFVLHAAGILASYMAVSYEKLVLDDEMCGMVRHLSEGFEVSPETLAYDAIAAVGSDGNYLVQPLTLKRCRTEFYQPAVCDRRGLSAWEAGGKKDAAERAAKRWHLLVEGHEDPPMEPSTRRALDAYLASRA